MDKKNFDISIYLYIEKGNMLIGPNGVPVMTRQQAVRAQELVGGDGDFCSQQRRTQVCPVLASHCLGGGGCSRWRHAQQELVGGDIDREVCPSHLSRPGAGHRHFFMMKGLMSVFMKRPWQLQWLPVSAAMG